MSCPFIQPTTAGGNIADPLNPLKKPMTVQEIDHRIRALTQHIYSLRGMGWNVDNKTLADLKIDFHQSCDRIGEMIKEIDTGQAYETLPGTLFFEIAKRVWQAAGAVGDEKWLCSPHRPVSSEGILPPGSLDETDDGLLLHQHGDSFGQGSGLEGEDSGKVMTFAKKFIEAALNTNPSSLCPQGSEEDTIAKMKQIVHLLNGALTIYKETHSFSRYNKKALDQNIASFIREKLHSDGCVLIPGGWGATPFGHSMYYEVKVQKNGLYSFSVFNRGAGLQHHGAPLEAPNKLLYPAYLKLVDIREEDLFNPRFIRGFIELQDTRANGEDFEIYEGLLSLLKGKVGKLDLELEDHMDSQKSGTCAWKSLSAFLRSRLTYREYKLFIYLIKQQSLQDYYKMNWQALETDIMKRNLFEKSLMTFAITLEKIGESKIIPFDEYEQAILGLAELKNKLNEADVRRLQNLQQQAPVATCEKQEIAWNAQIFKSTDELSTSKGTLTDNTIPCNELTQWLAEWQPSANKLNEDLRMIYQEFFNALQSSHFDDVHSAYLLVMKKFPVPEAAPQSEFWRGIQSQDSEKTAAAIETLSNLHDLFFKACNKQPNPELIDPRIYAAMYKSLALQDALIMLTGPEHLGMPNFSPPPDFTILCRLLRKPNREGEEERSFEFPLRDPQAIDDLTHVYLYFMERAKSISSSKPLPFSHYTEDPLDGCSISDSEAAESFFAKPLNPEFIYMKRLLADKEIAAKIEKMEPGFTKLKSIEQIAKLYTDESLAEFLPRLFRLYRRQIWQVQIASRYEMHAEPSTPLEKIALSSSYSGPHESITDKEHSVTIRIKHPSNTLNSHRSSFKKIYRSHCRREHSGINNIIQYATATSQNSILSDESTRIRQKYWLLPTNREVQITETVAFLMTHPEVFKVPELQNYFEMLLFESDLMLDELRRHPEFIHKIISFIHKTLESYREQGNIEASTFLIKISHFLEEHWEYVCKEDPSLRQGISNPHFVDTLEELKRLLDIGSLSNQEKSLLYSHLIAFSKDANSDLQQILLGLSHIDKHPLPLEWRDPAINREIRSTLQVLSRKIQSTSDEEMNGILNAIVNYHNPHANASYRWNCDNFPIFSNDESSCQIDIFKGRFYIAGSEAAVLPPEIVENSTYGRVFSPTHKRKRFSENEKQEGRQLNLDTFEITDAYGQRNRIRFDSKHSSLQIQREIDGQWFKYVDPKSSFGWGYSPNTPYAHLEKNFNLFESTDNPLVSYYCNKEGRPCYRLRYAKNDRHQNKLVGIDDLLHSPPLTLVYIYEDRYENKQKAKGPYDFLKAFEQSNEIGVWKDAAQEPKRIELPRFNLTFIAKTDPRGKMSWECQEIQGYFLSEKQFIEPLAKLNVTSFLKLENEKGENKILIPRQNLDKQSHGFKAERKFAREENIQKYLIYDYQRTAGRWERELKMGPEEGLYMAFLALSSGSDEGYRLARHLLDPNKFRVGKVHEEELEILNWICRSAQTTHDHDPKAVALRLHAVYLLNEQMERVSSQETTSIRLIEEKDFWQGVRADLSRYAATLQHSTGYHLPIHELVKLCKLQMANSSLSSNVVHYLEQLGDKQVGEWIQNLSKSESKSTYQKFRFEELQAFLRSSAGISELKEAAKRDDLSWREKDRMWIRSDRPSIFFLKKLPIAVNGTDAEKQKLRERLKIMLGDRKSIVYATVLEMILDYPDRFDISIGSTVGSKDVDMIIRHIKQIVEFAVQKYEYERSPLLFPKKMGGVQNPTPLSISPAASIVSKIPKILFGDAETFEASLEKVEEFELESFFHKIDEDELRIKREKENQKLDVVHGDVKEMLNIQTDRVGNKVIERLRGGCVSYLDKQSVKKDEFVIAEERVEEMIDNLDLHIQYRLQAQQREAIHLCLVAEADKEIAERDLLATIHKLGGKRESLTIDDLCLLYAKGGLESHLFDAVKRYLIEATYTQKLERIRQRAEEFMGAEGEDKAAAEIALVAEMRKVRTFDIDLHPECLLLEFKANILMNENQYENLIVFLKTGKIMHPIRHMIMGSGKTSVLMKLLALLRADGTRLSTLVLTDDLLDSMSEEVRSGSVNTFDQLIVPFEVDRKSDLSIEKLKELKEKLERIRRGKGALIMSPKSIHTFYLTLLETSFKSYSAIGRDRELLLEALGLQREIMRIFLTFGSALLDEADILLNCRTEVNFPFGKEMSMPIEEQELLLDLYDILLENPDICNILKCDFHPSSAGENAALYMQKTFMENIRPRIVDAYLEKMIAPAEGTVPIYKTTFQEYDEMERTHIRNYLLQVENDRAREEAQIFVDNIEDSQVKNILSLLKEELLNLLPMSLEKSCGEHYNYSLTTTLAYAIPCSSGRPNEGSRFSNAHETSNYTIQTSLKYGIQHSIIQKKLTSLQKQCTEELKSGKRLIDSEAYLEFVELCEGKGNYHLAKLSDKDKEEIIHAINSDRLLQRKFQQQYILPAIRFHHRKINSNAHMLARFFHRIDGFSGTLWNADTFPTMLSPEAEHDVDAMTLFLLSGHLLVEENGRITKTNNIIRVSKTDGESALQAAADALKDGINVLAIADNGGYMNDEDPDLLAKATTEKLHQSNPRIMGTAYHDRTSTLVVNEKGLEEKKKMGQSLLKKNERVTIYLQPFTTGTDIKQAPSAVQLLTIGRTTLLRDLFQTAWRMRELGRGQRIQFVVSDDIVKVIFQKLGLSPDATLTQNHIIKFCLLNQIEQLSDDTVVAAKMKMLNLVQWEVIKVFLDPNVSDEEASCMFIEEMQDLFAPAQATEAYDMYGKSNKKFPTEQVLQQELNNCMNLLMAVVDQVGVLKKRIDIERVRKELEELISKELLPEETLSPANETLDQQVQVQQKQKQKMKQREQTIQQEALKEKRDFTQWEKFPWPQVVPEKIFAPDYYQIPWSATAYRFIKDNISIPMPPAQHLVAPIAGVAYHYMPDLTFAVGAGTACFYALFKINRGMAALWNGLSDLSSEIGKHGKKWIDEQTHPFEVWGQGAPYPYSIREYLAKEPRLNPLIPFIDPRLFVTHNFAIPKAYSNKTYVSKPLDAKSKDVREMLLMQDKNTGDWKVLMIDKNEADYFRKQLAQDKKEKKPVERALRICLYHPIIGVVQQGAEAITDNEVQENGQLLELIVQMKFLNGESKYTEPEWNALKKWINKGDKKALEGVFREYILPTCSDAEDVWKKMKELF